MLCLLKGPRLQLQFSPSPKVPTTHKLKSQAHNSQTNLQTSFQTSSCLSGCLTRGSAQNNARAWPACLPRIAIFAQKLLTDLEGKLGAGQSLELEGGRETGRHSVVPIAFRSGSLLFACWETKALQSGYRCVRRPAFIHPRRSRLTLGLTATTTRQLQHVLEHHLFSVNEPACFGFALGQYANMRILVGFKSGASQHLVLKPCMHAAVCGLRVTCGTCGLYVVQSEVAG